MIQSTRTEAMCTLGTQVRILSLQFVPKRILPRVELPNFACVTILSRLLRSTDARVRFHGNELRFPSETGFRFFRLVSLSTRRVSCEESHLLVPTELARTSATVLQCRFPRMLPCCVSLYLFLTVSCSCFLACDNNQKTNLNFSFTRSIFC